MAVTFNDVNMIRKGQEATANEVATRNLDAMINDLEANTNAEHAQEVGNNQQQQSGDDQLTQQALQVLETLEDPNDIDNLPPELQQKVIELLNSEVPDEHPDLQQQQPLFNR